MPRRRQRCGSLCHHSDVPLSPESRDVSFAIEHQISRQPSGGAPLTAARSKRRRRCGSPVLAVAFAAAVTGAIRPCEGFIQGLTWPWRVTWGVQMNGNQMDLVRRSKIGVECRCSCGSGGGSSSGASGGCQRHGGSGAASRVRTCAIGWGGASKGMKGNSNAFLGVKGGGGGGGGGGGSAVHASATFSSGGDAFWPPRFLGSGNANNLGVEGAAAVVAAPARPMEQQQQEQEDLQQLRESQQQQFTQLDAAASSTLTDAPKPHGVGRAVVAVLKAELSDEAAPEVAFERQGSVLEGGVSPAVSAVAAAAAAAELAAAAAAATERALPELNGAAAASTAAAAAEPPAVFASTGAGKASSSEVVNGAGGKASVNGGIWAGAADAPEDPFFAVVAAAAAAASRAQAELAAAAVAAAASASASTVTVTETVPRLADTAAAAAVSKSARVVDTELVNGRSQLVMYLLKRGATHFEVSSVTKAVDLQAAEGGDAAATWWRWRRVLDGLEADVGLTGSDLASMLAVCPKLVEMNYDACALPTLEHLRTDLGLRPTDVRRVLRKAPEVLLERGDGSSILDTMQVLKSLGVSAKVLRSEVARRPRLLAVPASGYVTLAEWLGSEEVGFRASEVGALLRQAPWLAESSIDSQLRPALQYLSNSVGLPMQGLERVVRACPQALAASVPDELEPRVRFLDVEARIAAEDIPKVLSTFPLLLAVPLPRMRAALRFLLVDLEIPASDVSKMLRAFPSLLGLEVQRHMVGVVTYLRELGVQNVGRFVARLPPVLGYSVEESLRPKMNYLVSSMGLSAYDVLTFPAYFSYPLASVIEPRTEFLRLRRRPIAVVGVTAALTCGDADFARKVAKVTPELFQKFKALYLENRDAVLAKRVAMENLLGPMVLAIGATAASAETNYVRPNPEEESELELSASDLGGGAAGAGGGRASADREKEG